VTSASEAGLGDHPRDDLAELIQVAAVLNVRGVRDLEAVAHLEELADRQGRAFYLVMAWGKASPKQISEVFRWRIQEAVAVLEELSDAGLVVPRWEGVSREAAVYELTDAGRRAEDSLRGRLSHYLQYALASLDPGDLAALAGASAALSRLAVALGRPARMHRAGVEETE
jgi:DNA-binding MarR family transcriptional regulator